MWLASQRNTYAIKDGSLWAWGAGGAHLGLGESYSAFATVNTPTEITDPAITDYVSVWGHNTGYNPMAVTSGGCIYIWGQNLLGYLGRGHIYGGGGTEGDDGAAFSPIQLLTSKAHPPWPGP